MDFEQILDEDFARILSFLDGTEMLEPSLLCRSLHIAAALWEEPLWHNALAAAAKAKSGPGCADPAAVVSCAESLCVPAKTAFRVWKYLAQYCLPGLHEALHLAAALGHCRMLAQLLKAGANPHAAASISASNLGAVKVGTYPLHTAAKHSRLTVMDQLLAAGVDVDIADYNGLTALMEASQSGQVRAVHWLVSKGAALNRTNSFGYGALHFAAMVRLPTVVNLLLILGADPNCRHISGFFSGCTPLQAAFHSIFQQAAGRPPSTDQAAEQAEQADEDNSVKVIVRMLLRHGAHVDTEDHLHSIMAASLQRSRPNLLQWFEEICTNTKECTAAVA